MLAGCLRLAAAYNPQQINFTLPQPLQLFSLFLMALQRANKREIELSGLAASLWARWCGASFIPEERGCGTLSFHCFISFHNSIQELPSLFLHSSPLTNQSHAGPAKTAIPRSIPKLIPLIFMGSLCPLNHLYHLIQPMLSLPFNHLYCIKY